MLFTGIARIIHGVKSKNISKWSRIFVLEGILSIVLSLIVIASPLIGIFLLTFISGVNLLIIGIESISYAVGSHGFKTTAATNGKGKG